MFRPETPDNGPTKRREAPRKVRFKIDRPQASPPSEPEQGSKGQTGGLTQLFEAGKKLDDTLGGDLESSPGPASRPSPGSGGIGREGGGYSELFPGEAGPHAPAGPGRVCEPDSTAEPGKFTKMFERGGRGPDQVPKRREPRPPATEEPVSGYPGTGTDEGYADQLRASKQPARPTPGTPDSKPLEPSPPPLRRQCPVPANSPGSSNHPGTRRPRPRLNRLRNRQLLNRPPHDGYPYLSA